MKRKLAWLMICVMMIASIPFTAAAETVETVSDSAENVIEAVAEVAEVTEETVGESSDTIEEDDPFIQSTEDGLLFENDGQQGDGGGKTFPDITKAVATPSYVFVNEQGDAVTKTA